MNWAFRKFHKNQPQEDKAKLSRKLEADKAEFFRNGGTVNHIDPGLMSDKELAAPYLRKYSMESL